MPLVSSGVNMLITDLDWLSDDSINLIYDLGSTCAGTALCSSSP